MVVSSAVDVDPENRGIGIKAIMERAAKKRIFYIFLLAFTVCAALAAFFFTAREPRKALLEKMAEKVDLQAKAVHYTQVGSAGMTWEIDADSASYQKKGEVALFEKVRIRLVMKDGRVFVMRGDRGRMDTRSRDVSIEGNVVALSENGDRLTTERLVYIDKRRRIETNLPVVMENKKMRVRGVGMVLDLKGETLALLSRVRSESIKN